jgi:hypothetical protein
MRIADGENPRRDCRLGRLAVSSRRHPRRRGARCAGAVVGDRDEHRVDEPALAVIGLVPADQQRDDISVGAVLHQRHKVVPTHDHPIAVRVGDCAAPHLHVPS